MAEEVRRGVAVKSNMKNDEIAAIFEEIAQILEIQGENSFKVRSYERAADIIKKLDRDIGEIAAEGVLREIPGIGASTAEKIQEYIKTGHIEKFELLKKEIPQGLLEMLKVPGLGPKKVKTIYEKLKIKDMRGLEIAARRGELAALPGFGAKTEQNIREGIELILRSSGRMLVDTADLVVEDFSVWLKKNKNCERFLVCGSVRRGCETVGDIDIVALSKKPEDLIKEFSARECVEKVLAMGDTKGSVYTRRKAQVDIRVVPEKSFGAAVMYFTGSKNHNIHLRKLASEKGFTLNEYGLYRIIKNARNLKYAAGRCEEDVYKKLGLQYIPPELREDLGEIEAALKNLLPELLELKDIKGDLHIHSVYSDGQARIEEIARRAVDMGYEWIAICDHSQSLAIANGVSVKNLEKKRKEIEALNKKLKLKILIGAEVDILPDGKLDYPDEILKKLDVSIAAIHSAFKQQPEDLNKRIMKAMDNPYVDIIAHPTGRLIGQRNALPVDIEKLIEKAVLKNIVLEVNAFPDRLDMKDTSCRKAVEKGAKLSLGTDAHALYQLDNMKFGVKNIRRGWVSPGSVINTMNAEKLMKFIAERRKK